jgi:hypothetical protein
VNVALATNVLNTGALMLQAEGFRPVDAERAWGKDQEDRLWVTMKAEEEEGHLLIGYSSSAPVVSSLNSLDPNRKLGLVVGSKRAALISFSIPVLVKGEIYVVHSGDFDYLHWQNL